MGSREQQVRELQEAWAEFKGELLVAVAPLLRVLARVAGWLGL